VRAFGELARGELCLRERDLLFPHGPKYLG
jgi:hypothetical protein